MQKVTVGEEEVLLDEANLEVSEQGLNEFLCKFAGIYNYYSARWSEAQYYTYYLEDRADTLYAKRFEFYKAEGNTDKLAEARAKASDDVVEARSQARRAKLSMQQINGYLRSLDKAHENALNLGYNIRKEMSALYPRDIKNVDQELEKILSEG